MRGFGAWMMFRDYEKLYFNPYCLGLSADSWRRSLSAGSGYSSPDAACRTHHRRQPFSRLMKSFLPVLLALFATTSAAQDEGTVDPDAARRAQLFEDSRASDLQKHQVREASGPPRSLSLSPLLSNDLNDTLKRDEIVEEETPLIDTPAEDEVEEQSSLLAEDVFVAQLSSWDIAAVGTLTPDFGGLEADSWGDATLSEALSALEGLPVDVASPTLQNLLQKLLLSALNPPRGSDAQGWMLIEKRLQLIRARGDVEGLAGLLDRLPALEGPESLAPVRVDGYLMAGDFASACAETQRRLRDNPDAYWLEIDIACRAMSGDMAGARLALDAMREQSYVDPHFATLIEGLFETQLASLSADTVLQRNTEWPEDVEVTPLYFALAQAQGRPLPEDKILASPLMRMALAGSPAYSPAQRLLAAEQAVATGLFDASRLAAIALSIPVQLEGAENLGLDAAAAGRVNAFQAAVSLSDPGLKMAALRDLWRAAEESDVYQAWALASASIAMSIEPAPAFVEMAPEIVPVLALAGERERVIDWYRLVRAASSPAAVGREAAEIGTRALLQIWPLALIHDEQGQVPFSPRIVELWWQSQIALDDAAKAEKAMRLFSILEGLGYDVPAESWALVSGLGSEGVLPSLELPDSQTRGPKALAIIDVVKMMGTGRPAQANTDDLKQAISDLDLYDMVDAARGLAVEALTGSRL